MAYTVGLKSIYYDVMYVLGDHAYEKFESIPMMFEEDGEPILTWRHDILWWLYGYCIGQSYERGSFVHSSIPKPHDDSPQLIETIEREACINKIRRILCH